MAACLALAACGKKEKVHQAAPAKPSSSTDAAPERTSFEEPPEKVLRAFMFKAYEKMDAAGGVPATVTASGKSGVIRMKLYEARKNDCKLVNLPHSAPPGMFECSMNLQVKMWWDHQREPREPGDDNKRISVIQDDRGNWLDCSHEREANKAFCDVRAAKKRKAKG